LVRSRLKWVCHVKRLGDDKLAKRTYAQKVKGINTLGRPRLRCEDNIKIYMERVRERETEGESKYRKNWSLLIENVVT